MKAVELKSITKIFGKTIANSNIDFDLHKGEIHAILGENGAGKTTLMSILAGLYQPNKGLIRIYGKELKFKSPRDAIDAGIGMIHQHFMLIQTHTVLDNIILGTKLPIILNRKKLSHKIIPLCKKLNFQIDLYDRVYQLSVGEQQRVEIIKALYRGAKILILDEPTAILTPLESEALFETLKSMKNEGYSIVFVSHKFNEVLALSDRITILRKGQVVATIKNHNVKKEDLARLMVERDIQFDLEIIQAKNEISEVTLSLKNVYARNDRNLKALDNVSFDLHSGEILGIAGVSGNGQSELAEAITGLRKVESGSICIMGEDVTSKSTNDIIQMGVAYIPEDRINTGSIESLGICDNILLKCYNLFSLRESSKINDYSENLAKKYDVVYSDLSSPVKYLSGGNLQKLIIARELREIPKLLIAAYPTRGLDIGAAEYVRKIILDCRDNGTAILLISEDLDELLSFSDKIMVIYEGRLVCIPDRDIQKISLAMAGS